MKTKIKSHFKKILNLAVFIIKQQTYFYKKILVV